MAEGLVEPGFCQERCEVDEYLETSRILGIVTDIEGPDSKLGVATTSVSAIQVEVLEESVRGASRTPCSGRLQTGYRVEGWPPGDHIHCPVIARALGNLNMAHFSE